MLKPVNYQRAGRILSGRRDYEILRIKNEGNLLMKPSSPRDTVV